jgi:hypothetical protein
MFASHKTINQLSQVQYIVSESWAARIAFAAATAGTRASQGFMLFAGSFSLSAMKKNLLKRK